jgi:hypothetical protein
MIMGEWNYVLESVVNQKDARLEKPPVFIEIALKLGPQLVTPVEGRTPGQRRVIRIKVSPNVADKVT